MVIYREKEVLLLVDHCESNIGDNFIGYIIHVKAIDGSHECHESGNSGMNKSIPEGAGKGRNQYFLLCIIA